MKEGKGFMRRHLFANISEIDKQVRKASSFFVGLDFDGTLVPFTRQPEDAILPQTLRPMLTALANNKRVTTAVFSGRDRQDLQQRVGINGLVYAGNHGLEISGPGFVFVESAAVAWHEELRALKTDLQERLRSLDGCSVEDKGLTLSVHFRQLPDAATAETVRRLVHESIAAVDHPFLVSEGPEGKALEIRPRGFWNKGAAVSWLLEHHGKPDTLMIYLGDDPIDEDVFAAFPNAITVKVGTSQPTAARYWLTTAEEVQKFLDWLVDTLRERGETDHIAETHDESAPAVAS